MQRYECRVGRVDADITTYWLLSKMGWVATKLYNTALWHARKTWDDTGKIPSGFDLQKVVLASPHHDILPAHTYQHPAHQVGMAFRSWFVRRKKDNTANPPGFRKKEETSSFLFTEGAFRFRRGRGLPLVCVKGVGGRGTPLPNKAFAIELTLTKRIKEEMSYPHKYLSIQGRWNTTLPPRSQVTQIEVVPIKNSFEIHAKIKLPEPAWKTEGIVVCGDLGEKNPIVTLGEDNILDIYRGGKILSMLRYANKEKSRVLSEVTGRTKGKKKWSNTLTRMSKKFTRQVNHAIHTMTDNIVQDCVKRNVREVVVGDLRGIKKSKDGTGKKWNKKSNQNWQQFPVRKVVAQLSYKLARHCIRLIEQDERGTSKGRCSICGCMDRKKIHRTHRGCFYCENCGSTINADVNGVGNQLARYLHQGTGVPEGSSGVLAIPLVHRWDDHNWSTVVAI